MRTATRTCSGGKEVEGGASSMLGGGGAGGGRKGLRKPDARCDIASRVSVCCLASVCARVPVILSGGAVSDAEKGFSEDSVSSPWQDVRSTHLHYPPALPSAFGSLGSDVRVEHYGLGACAVRILTASRRGDPSAVGDGDLLPTPQDYGARDDGPAHQEQDYQCR
jgi:hypothetical protein